ncbi:MAG: tetraacyldisaccharide 4'-kinase [Endomicrobia bacterium]|nr:tetraacyldisaccharide 4'-kinase [Endomicrobiia bacterium]
MNKLLYPLSLAYWALSNADRRFCARKKLSKPVISVGNITWGGTGKTPIVIELLKLAVQNNLKPVVLTRGYGRKTSSPALLENGALHDSAQKSGDEPLLIARSVPMACVIAGAYRYENALIFEKYLEPDLYVLDDGFQHWKIERDLDIVCVNAANPFGNGMLIPAGILREKPGALERAGLVIITNCDMVADEKVRALEREIFGYGGKVVLSAYYGGYEYKTLDLAGYFDLDFLKSSIVYSLCAIGFGDGFKNSLKKSGIEIRGSFDLPDHGSYDLKTLKSFLEKAGRGACLVTTAKDAVKIADVADDEIKERTAVLTITPQFKTGEDEWEKTILNVINGVL